MYFEIFRYMRILLAENSFECKIPCFNRIYLDHYIIACCPWLSLFRKGLNKDNKV